MAIVTIAEAKTHLEIDPNETRYDQTIYDLIDVAQEEAAAWCNIDLATLDPMPKAISQAIKLRVKHYFDEDTGEVLPNRVSRTNAFHRLLSPYVDYLAES